MVDRLGLPVQRIGTYRALDVELMPLVIAGLRERRWLPSESGVAGVER
jgi:hypothetical protein